MIFNPEISAIFAPEAGRGADEVQLATLVSLAEALDLRDTGTSDHSWTVGRYCAHDRRRARPAARARASASRSPACCTTSARSGCRTRSSRSPARSARRELAEIRTHPEIGAQILNGRGLEDLREWVLAHHERPDGKGYPRGLTDAEIPLEAKILAVADAFEAMTADRVYRAGIEERAARAELLRCAGRSVRLARGGRVPRRAERAGARADSVRRR